MRWLSGCLRIRAVAATIAMSVCLFVYTLIWSSIASSSMAGPTSSVCHLARKVALAIGGEIAARSMYGEATMTLCESGRLANAAVL